MEYFSEAEVLAILKAAGIPVDKFSEDLVAWAVLMTNNAAATAAAVMEPGLYEALRASVTKPADPKALKAAEEAWRSHARKQADTLARNLAESELKTMGQTIAQGIEEGIGPKEVARRLQMVQGLDPQRAATLRNFEASLRASGLSEENIAAQVERKRQQLIRERRETIAATEMRYATSEAALDTAKQRGARFKVWLSTGDARVSDVCQANEAAGPIPIDEAFPSGVQTAPAHPRCRCSVSYITSDEQLDRARERAGRRAANTEAAKGES